MEGGSRGWKKVVSLNSLLVGTTKVDADADVFNGSFI